MRSERLERFLTVFNNNSRPIFVVVLTGLILLRVIEVLFYNKIAGADAVFISYAQNILKGRLAIDTHGDFLNFDRYYFCYPFLHPGLMALAFKVFGISYKAAKVVPVIFNSLCILTAYIFSKKYIGELEAVLVSLLLAFDHLFFSYGNVARPEMVTLFFFTLAALAYFKADQGGSWGLLILSAVLSGLAFLASLNALWLVIAFLLYQVVCGKIIREGRRFLAYMTSFFIIISPYYLWIFLNAERRAIFLVQVFGANSSLGRGSSLPLVIRNLLNPLADLYLMVSRFGSMYPLIFAIVIVYFVFNFRKYAYLLFVLLSPIFMLLINERAAHYLLITMPVCYISLGFVVKAFKKRSLGSLGFWLKRAVVSILVFFFLFNFCADLKFAFNKPSFLVDESYYRNALERYTESDARIVADHSLLLSITEGRKIFSPALLVWDKWQSLYAYEEIVARINPDYIILTAQMRDWIDPSNTQYRLFQELLKQNFVLKKKVSDPRYGELWIYQRKFKV